MSAQPLIRSLFAAYALESDTPKSKPKRGFVVLPERWVVQRTNAWTLRFRRLNVDHDRNTHVTRAWIWLAHSHILLRRALS